MRLGEGDDELYIELHVWATVRRSPLIVFSRFSYFDLCQTCRGKRNDGLVCKTYTGLVYQEHVIIVVEKYVVVVEDIGYKIRAFIKKQRNNGIINDLIIIL